MTNLIGFKQPDISISACSYRRVLEIISNKWTALVIYALDEGSLRYGEVRRRIEGISQKMLTQTLRQLERDGLIRRDITPSVPPMVEYSLTPLGESLSQLMRPLKQWTNENYPLVEKAREEYDQREEE
ncbi:winged helix-turn-helix transcriptional regulator [Paenibacillus prosopidis]|uniref:HxlR family transcriptional regulator n=1 Tax=Paenibacillus prosopidis TaxID=630520 RepID=A0A368W7Y2_9BACL|nr:helix-turn-helix domain-containing protein [Paenibacillus prosopidis]RCW48534.1 HxlR family transcriptional regulator [Paenibacillus prosopidis]